MVKSTLEADKKQILLDIDVNKMLSIVEWNSRPEVAIVYKGSGVDHDSVTFIRDVKGLIKFLEEWVIK